MIENLRSHIKAYLAQNNLNLAELEKKFAFKSHSVRNLISGKSKNPNLELLLKLSKILETPIDLMLSTSVPYGEKPNAEGSQEADPALRLFYVCCWTVFWIVHNQSSQKDHFHNISQGVSTRMASRLFEISRDIAQYCEDANNGSFDKTFALWKLKDSHPQS